MQALNCLIVEDEPLAVDVIRDYINQVPGLIVKGVCENAFEAMEKLREEKIDLIFLDINLPKLSGIDFIKSVRNKYHIILTTAYHEFALHGYDLNVTDYLLKPIEFNRFLQAVDKVRNKKNLYLDEEKRSYFFNVDKKRTRVYAEEILFIEALKDYVRIHLRDKKIVTKLQIGEMEGFLQDKDFLRIHKSFMVNLSKINAYSSSEVEIGNRKITIGRTYKKDVEKILALRH